MARPKLIFRVEDYSNFNQGWVRPWVEQHFEMVEYDAGTQYAPNTPVLATYQQDFVPDAWFRTLEQRGHPVIIDHLYDSDVDTKSFRINDRKLDLRSGHWMWYSSALHAQHSGYDQYRPQPCYTHDFLCLMNKIRDHRDRVAQDLAPQLQTARWSYVDRGQDIGDAQERATPVFWEFYMNPNWYDSTCWHFVVESYMRSDSWFAAPEYPNYRTEISEKSYKPLAYFQPFVVLGSNHTLAFLQSQGFETFDNLWSEHYDTVASDQERLSTVFDLVRDIVQTYNRHWGTWDVVTQEKISHNHARFFDLDLVHQRFDAEIIGDIKEFLSL